MQNHLFGNVPLVNAKKEDLLQTIGERLLYKQKTKIFFLNAHCFNIAQQDKVYRQQLQRADLVLNDGIGVELGAKLLGVHLKDNLNGTDFTPDVLRLTAANGMKVFLLGGEPGIAQQASGKISEDFPGIQIAGHRNGFFTDTEELLEEICKAKPDLLLVGLGVPLQEKWISAYADRMDVPVIMAVGAFLDFTAGKVPRAPLMVRKMRMEWLFRLAIEPKRMWKRYIWGNGLFFWNVLKLKFKRPQLFTTKT